MEAATEHLSTSDEQDVVRRVLDGDKEEYRLLVRVFQARIYALIMRMVGDESAAKELTQDAFLKAYLNLAQFRSDARFGTWLTRIAVNTTNSYLSSRTYRQRCKTIAISEAGHEAAVDEAQYDRFDSSEIRRLEQIIRGLSPKLREVCILCGLEQRSYQEAASILQIPVGTVRSRLNRARCQVRKHYFEESK